MLTQNKTYVGDLYIWAQTLFRSLKWNLDRTPKTAQSESDELIKLPAHLGMVESMFILQHMKTFRSSLVTV